MSSIPNKFSFNSSLILLILILKICRKIDFCFVKIMEFYDVIHTCGRQVLMFQRNLPTELHCIRSQKSVIPPHYFEDFKSSTLLHSESFTPLLSLFTTYMWQVTGFKMQQLAMLVKLQIVGHMVIWLI
jgi:hypothetical protein